VSDLACSTRGWPSLRPGGCSAQSGGRTHSTRSWLRTARANAQHPGARLDVALAPADASSSTAAARRGRSQADLAASGSRCALRRRPCPRARWRLVVRRIRGASEMPAPSLSAGVVFGKKSWRAARHDESRPSPFIFQERTIMGPYSRTGADAIARGSVAYVRVFSAILLFKSPMRLAAFGR